MFNWFSALKCWSGRKTCKCLVDTILNKSNTLETVKYHKLLWEIMWFDKKVFHLKTKAIYNSYANNIK